MKTRMGLLLAILGWFFWPIPGQAQITFEVGSDPGASRLGRMLLDSFQQSDPALMIVHSSYMNHADIEFALRTGALDFALLRLTTSDRGGLFGGMSLHCLGRDLRKRGGASRRTYSGRLCGVSSPSPAPEVRRFLDFVSSPEGAEILRRVAATPVASK